MIVFRITGLKRTDSYYCKDVEEVSETLKLLDNNQSVGIQKIEMTEEEYNKFPAINLIN